MQTTLSFSEFLKEELDVSSIPSAMKIIISYLNKKTGSKFFRYPGIEKFTSGENSGHGIRLYSKNGEQSIRFNWSSKNVNMMALQSIDVFNGKSKKTIEFDKKVSLVKTLPVAAAVLTGSNMKDGWTMPDEAELNESALQYKPNFIVESVSSNMNDIFDGVVDMLTDPKFSRLAVYKAYRSAGQKIFDYLVANASEDVITKNGNKFVFVGTKADLKKFKDDKDRILTKLGCVKVSVRKGSSDETYEPSAKEKYIEDNVERLVYEKQLEHMENLIRMTISGASNALFIAGRGGVGKTHGVEKILGQAGLRDGAGYFKNTGSATAAGMYSLLFKYKDKVILFDDSDDALKDQESRNIIKAATDTKKKRKLVWNKMGKNVADPDGDLTDEEILDQGLIPRYFEFTGRIIFISNLSMDKLDPDGAIRTRAFMIDIDPTDEEVYEHMEKIVDDMEIADGLTLSSQKRKDVIALLKAGKSKQTANFRKLQRGLNMAAGAGAAGVSISGEELAKMIALYA
jgi:hypothetical protein